MNLENIISLANSSCRYKKAEIPAEDVEALLRAALYAIACMQGNTCEIYLTDKPLDMARLSDARDGGRAKSLKDAPLLLAIAANPVHDVAMEEHCEGLLQTICSEATALGLTPCPVKIMGYYLSDGEKCEDCAGGILNVADGQAVYAVVGLGYAEKAETICDEDDLAWGRIHVIE